MDPHQQFLALLQGNGTALREVSDDLAGGPPNVHYLPHHGVHCHYLLLFHNWSDIPTQSLMSHIFLKFSQNVPMEGKVKQLTFIWVPEIVLLFKHNRTEFQCTYSVVGFRFNLNASIKTPSHSPMTLINVAFLII